MCVRLNSAGILEPLFRSISINIHMCILHFVSGMYSGSSLLYIELVVERV